MKDHVDDLKKLREMVVKVQKQLQKTQAIENQSKFKEAFEEEKRKLISEYKMALLKKGKIQNDYDTRRTRFLGMIDGRRDFNQLGVPEPDISSSMLAGRKSTQ